MSNVEKLNRVHALNALKAENKIKLILNKDKILYELVVEELSPEDLVLSVIKESGKNGIWIRDIRFKTRLSQIILNKTLKGLENKKLIRSIKSISNKKLYVLFDLEPDESVTGGACYDSGFIREDIVKNLKSTCFQYLYDIYKESYDSTIESIHSNDAEMFNFEKMYATASEVHKKFASRNIFQEIKLGDIEQILNILTYECKLLKLSVGNKTVYRFNPYNREKTDMFYAPCMVCHLYNDCKPSSFHISPENCQYLHYNRL